jgi:sulfite exporter TauE/SafE
MEHELIALMVAAITISFLHTVTGPDHYLPFIALSKARGWSVGRTLLWTAVCGCGHVWSSVLLGLGGAAIGWSLSFVHSLQSVRGGIAGWALLLFGLTYCIWGLIRSTQNRRHKHFDINDDGSIYVYEHRHGEVVAPRERNAVTPWVMFLIFAFGPCEPMIPLLYFPAAKNSWSGMLLLVAVYTIFTLLAMMLMVVLCFYGASLAKAARFERYIHALSGLSIFICGVGMVFIGW